MAILAVGKEIVGAIVRYRHFDEVTISGQSDVWKFLGRKSGVIERKMRRRLVHGEVMARFGRCWS